MADKLSRRLPIGIDEPDRAGQTHIIMGVDEAGRGPVLGPLVVGGFAITDEAPLRSLGVKDSKQIAPQRREQLYDKLQDLGYCSLVSLEAEDLDALRTQMSLNRIEARLFASTLKGLLRALEEAGALSLQARPAGAAPIPELTVYLDAADANAKAFGQEVRGRLFGSLGREIPLRLVSEHKADEHYPVVGAASILAKVTRDRALAALERSLGEPIGSGYPADLRTQEFIKGYFADKGTLPPGVRRSWKTVDRLLRPQVSLNRFTTSEDTS